MSDTTRYCRPTSSVMSAVNDRPCVTALSLSHKSNKKIIKKEKQNKENVNDISLLKFFYVVSYLRACVRAHVLILTTFPGRSVHSPVKYGFFTVAYNIRPKFGRTFGTRSVSLPKPSASAECYSLTFGPSLLQTHQTAAIRTTKQPPVCKYICETIQTQQVVTFNKTTTENLTTDWNVLFFCGA